VILVMFGCVGVSTLGLDVVCYGALTRRMPLYPNANVTFEQHNFLRSFGVGETVMILESEDEPSVVRSWYGRTIGQTAQEAAEGKILGYTLARVSWTVQRAETGNGSEIFLSGTCGQ
jgi:hypothetical protein